MAYKNIGIDVFDNEVTDIINGTLAIDLASTNGGILSGFFVIGC
jgi:hypothetical protein